MLNFRGANPDMTSSGVVLGEDNKSWDFPALRSLPHLTNVVAVVSGGASGIGLMVSLTLIANGAKVYIIGPKQADLDRIAQLYNAEAEKIPGGGKIIGIEGDISVKLLPSEFQQDRRKTSFGGPSAPRMFRTARSPTRTDSNTYSDDSYEDSNSIDEVEATLNNLDDELDDTEQALSTWSSSTPDQTRSYYSSTGYGTYTGTGTGSYSYSATQSGYTGSPSFVSLPGLLNPSSPSTHSRNYPPASNDPRIRLSHITERTEGTESRPVSGVSQATTIPARPRSAFISSGHGRHSTDPSADRDLPPPGRANELIGLFEATSSGSRPNSPTKPLTSTSYTRSQTPTTTLSSLMSPPLRPSTAAGTSTYTGSAFAPNTLSSSAFTPSATQTGTGTGTYTNTGTYTTGTYTSTDTYTATAILAQKSALECSEHCCSLERANSYQGSR
ncbi:hypothetical protein Moror_7588 [Moniliophthora roreri MCA 2997]|uniref:Uncharacterized protein n=1 Tax=Moniliophthora roreri (strain MCA 2997) TaxID=1381753 RepID=V2WQK7_MONRO|nr:hypothetical protein Moror_7588 [Moniliophthora roreri MCA 2997]